MKCSDCSAEIKPIVAIDIDGTLADYHGHFIDFLQTYLQQWAIGTYRGEGGFKEWAIDQYGIDERTWHDVKLAYRQGAQKRSAPAYPQAAALTDKLRAEGAEIWLTTTRPYLRLDNVDPDTRFWLDRNGIVFDHLIYDKDKYAVLAGQVDPGRVCGVLEDLPYQYDRAAEIFGVDTPVLSKQRYNAAVHRPNEVHGLDYAIIELGNRLLDWRVHQS